MTDTKVILTEQSDDDEEFRKMFLPLIEYLKEVGCEKKKHSKGTRNLLHHLVSVSAILSERGASDDLCKAGLFHSIYGTSFYKNKTVSLDERDKIKELIGVWAETLVYEFCMLPKDRRSAIMKLENGPLRNDLIDLNYANYDEQRMWKEKNDDNSTQ